MPLKPGSGWTVCGLLLLSLSGCAEEASQIGQESLLEDSKAELEVASMLADVVSVETTGEGGGYRFEVGIASPDEGCDQYANWWEVITEQGELLYRRILAHSHVTEQPFVRSGGPVAIEPGTIVIVRAHMHPGGYGGEVFRGSVESGFEAADLPQGFAANLAGQEPLPQGCAN